MSVANPTYATLAVLILPLLALFLFWANRQRLASLQRLGNPKLIERLSQTVNQRGRAWQKALWLATAGLMLFALARPQWGEEVQTIEREGVQVMVALDVSESMLAEDIKPNRLSRAKLEIADLMNRLGGDEVGLVLFSGASFIQFPLTSDYATARSFLDGARPSVISKPGTNIGDAVRTAMSGFDEKSNSQRVIVLITDGEAHDVDALSRVQAAADEGVIFYTIGFGSAEGVPIPEFDPRAIRLVSRPTRAVKSYSPGWTRAPCRRSPRLGVGVTFRPVQVARNWTRWWPN
ncbi:MAG: VWA domain-containing protein [Caldilineaceae bacterium]|nr:VWA domain-containing protein [Caldilineaceae bacterium]